MLERVSAQGLLLLESLPLVAALRDSFWVYPLVNAGHLLGVALLVGAILPLDLRLLGLWRRLPAAPLWTVLTGTAAIGLSLAVICGLLLFAVRATDYTASSLFILKMLLVATGVLNALLVRVWRPAANAAVLSRSDLPPARLRLAALVSMLVWPATLLLGRFVGYF